MSKFLGSLRERWNAVEALFLPPAAWERGLLHFWRERILLVVCLVSLVVGFLALIPSINLAVKEELWSVAILDTVAYLAIFVLLLGKVIPFQIRAWLACAVLYFLGMGLVVMLGLVGAGYIWLFAFAIFTGLLLGLRAGIISLLLNAASLAAVAALIGYELVPWARGLENALEKWITLSSSFLLINAIVTVATAITLRGLQLALDREHCTGLDLKAERERLREANLLLRKEMRERGEAEEALRRSEKRYRELFNSISDLIYTQDLEGCFTSVNRNLYETFGYGPEEMLGMKASDLMHPDFRAAYQDVYLASLRRDGKYEGVSVYYAKDGDAHFIEYRSNLMNPEDGEPYISGSGRDITERVTAEKKMKALQGQLQQAKKMEAIGTLAGGIAHDFNNILGAIMGYAELGLDLAREDTVAKDEIRQILLAADRAKELVKQILTFSRKSEPELEPLNLNEVVLYTVPVIQRTIPKMIEVKLSLAPQPVLINGDPTQLEQILLNLASNAKDAMPEGGRLVIETTLVSLDREYAEAHFGMEPGVYALMTVSDSGQGMDKESVEHIFEPFYTTKEVGKGTGLGLSSVYGIVKSHGGAITCYSEPGQGTSFGMYFPPLKPEESSGRVLRTDEGTVVGGSETILLVDDEEALQNVGERILQAMGYQVVTADSGEEAVELYKSWGDQTHLVIMDVNMPGMGGYKAIAEILAADPQAKVIVASGYAAGGRPAALEEPGVHAYISKPYRKVELLRTVRQVLDG